MAGLFEADEVDLETYPENGYGIPVLTYEELTGLLLGYNPWDIGLQTHQVAVKLLPDKPGKNYEPGKKYHDFSGVNIGIPEKPRLLRCC